MKIAVIGAGYVGLVTAACLAEDGHEVLCMDKDVKKVKALQLGKLPIYEPGLQELIAEQYPQRLRFTVHLEEAIQSAQLIFLAVDTPSLPDGRADLSNISHLADAIARCMSDYKVIVLKSTVPPGTARTIRERMAKLCTPPFDVVSNPEFLGEGSALRDFHQPDRIVIGVQSPQAAEWMQELYRPYVLAGVPLLMMSSESAEMTKYASNAMLASRISLMNEIAQLCEQVGADVDSVRQGVGADKRIGGSHLFAGLGYGGSCFPKDIKALIQLAKEHEISAQVLQAVDTVNAEQRKRWIAKIFQHFQGDLEGRRIALWGLSFKPHTDDLREAPSLTIIEALLKANAKVQAYDPKSNGKVHARFQGKVQCVESAYEALTAAEALVLVTEWDEFRSPDFPRMKSIMASPVIFDGRNMYDPHKVRQLGFVYFGVGRS